VTYSHAPAILVDKTCAKCGQPMRRVPMAKYCFDCFNQRQVESTTKLRVCWVGFIRGHDGAWRVAGDCQLAHSKSEAQEWMRKDLANRHLAQVKLPR
jgi:hypothetical protein